VCVYIYIYIYILQMEISFVTLSNNDVRNYVWSFGL